MPNVSNLGYIKLPVYLFTKCKYFFNLDYMAMLYYSHTIFWLMFLSLITIIILVCMYVGRQAGR